ncbi:MAG: M23 family metallopeptidase [Sphingomonadales bacterium]|nr:M23 family metallopeptidase [Sphingomonadales bacterium]
MRPSSKPRQRKLWIVAAIASLCGIHEAASARVRGTFNPPDPLEVRFKDEQRPQQPANGPFTLLAAFPEVALQRIVEQAQAKRARMPTRSLSTALTPLAGNPLPARSEVLSSGYGMRRHPILGVMRPHMGVDLAAPTGTPVYATADGVVSSAGWRGGYGLSVTLGHARGFETRYGHMSRINAIPGGRVRRGDVIGWVGSTGLSTGPHLHYETLVRGEAVNPLSSMRRRR